MKYPPAFHRYSLFILHYSLFIQHSTLYIVLFGGVLRLPWYWIVIIIGIIVGPFETLYTYNKLTKRRRDNAARQDKNKTD